MVERYLPADRGTIVLHWFTGSKSEAPRAAALGCYFCVNAEMTRSDRGRAVVSDLPIARLLTRNGWPIHSNRRPSQRTRRREKPPSPRWPAFGICRSMPSRRR
nr:TatD family hydrolase [Mesorhizobium sp.]